MLAFLVRLIVNAVAIWVAALVVDQVVPGGIVIGRLDTLVVVALIFGIVNALIRPIVLMVTCLINLLTLGLFTFIVNALMLLLTSYVSEMVLPGAFHVSGFIPAFLGAIVISVVSFLLTHLIRE